MITKNKVYIQVLVNRDFQEVLKEQARKRDMSLSEYCGRLLDGRQYHLLLRFKEVSKCVEEAKKDLAEVLNVVEDLKKRNVSTK